MNNKVYIVTHTNPAIKTVRDFVNEMGSPAFAYANDIEAFGKVEIRKGYTNRQALIEAQLLAADRKVADQAKTEDIKLVPHTKLAIEVDKVDRCALLTEGIEVVSNDITLFKAEKLASLEADTGYKLAVDLQRDPNIAWLGKTMQRYPNATVWIWTKALSDPKSEDINGKIFDLTPYITRLVTNVSRTNGGHFQLSLAPIRCELVNNTWILRTADRKDFDNVNSIGRKEFFANSNLFKVDGAIGADGSRTLARNSFLFNNIITPNDVVFIRLETLEMEKIQREKDQLADVISKNSLPDRIYDMIGLVDKTSISVNAGANDVTIEVSGRDLSKLIYDDGTYFFPFEFAKGNMGSFGSAANSNPLLNRLSDQNAIHQLAAFNNRSLDNIIRFIIQQLSTIKIVPDDLFSAYDTGDKSRLNKRYDPVPANITSNEQLRSKLDAHKNAAKKIFANLRSQKALTLKDEADETKKVEEIFAETVRFFKHIREKKVRRVSGNATTGWDRNTYVKKEGGNEDIRRDWLAGYIITALYGTSNQYDPAVSSFFLDKWIPEIDAYIDMEGTQLAHKPELQEQLAKGIWQIVKLVVDESISNRMLIDSSLSTASGSLINFFRKVCQHPFVEFQMDTYGDMFYIMLRKPPFDRKSILSALNGTSRTEKDSGTDTTGAEKEKKRPVVITIESSQVLSETLEFADAEAVSWYQLIPKANPIGQRNSFAMAALPALYFPEYAECFGSRAMQLTHNYLPSTAFNGRTAGDLNVIEAQTVFDLKHMIESTAYLPFTRQGTISILRDRRIKAGNFIRFQPTGEIFFVEAVQHNLQVTDTSVEATTSIQVSRGMVEQLIYGINIEAQPGSADTEVVYASYFNIIQTISETRYAELKQHKQSPVTPTPAAASAPASPATAPASPAKAATTAVRKDEQLNLTVNKANRRSELDANNDIAKGVLERYSEAQWPIIRDFIRAINSQTDYWVIILPDAGPRTRAEQTILWEQNKKNARPGTSRHEKGAALDISLKHKVTNKVISKSTPKDVWKATRVVEIGDRMGMQWTDGRGNGNFPSRSGGTPYYDPVHFQIKDSLLALPGKSESYVQPDPPKEVLNKTQSDPGPKYVAGNDDVFKYFKVNKPVFNYFMKRLQMNPLYQQYTNTHVQVGPNDNPQVEIIAKRPKKSQ
ncbi:hypothetical protein SAMN05444266_102216 [Chitinophaga jiangningensis]|uniref:D-alanyl-D-alanine carboxypeptidase n=1 Tax=Chitinophaga jiangningensis TaxID=1419482 RepID=A0A1M6Y9J2_9BACT|nr:hypothetical protein [Chitinophaga jiangningensis]SHL14934.1 hypothetical protein SAMN05444266_102216 [Chitinophaga jiangningensis]